MSDIINMTITTPPAVNQSITGFGIKGDTGATGAQGPKGDAGDPATNLVASVAGKTGAVTLDKTDVGLSNVDNLAPADMPVSTAQQTALDGKFTQRAITGTTNQITVTNGDGVSGNPTLSLPQNIHTGATPTFAKVTANGTASGTVGSVVTNWLTILPANGTSGNSSFFLDNGGSATPRVWEIFCNGSGTMGFYAKTGGAYQAMSINSSSGFIGLGDNTRTPTERLQVEGNVAPRTDSTYNLGTSSLYWKETYTDKLFLNSTATLDGSTAGEIKGTGIFTADNIKRGTGFPEGVVTANVGTVYIDTAITNGASSWIKKSGTGNTGWQVLEGSVQKTFTTNSGTAALRVQLTGRTIFYAFEGTLGATVTNPVLTLPDGYRPNSGYTFLYGNGGSPFNKSVTIAANGEVSLFSSPTPSTTIAGTGSTLASATYPTT